MNWKEELKFLLGLPEEARIITRPYYRDIPKKNGKTYRALTIQYVHQGEKRYKHINKDKEPLVIDLINGEETILSYAKEKLNDIKHLIESAPDEGKTIKVRMLEKEVNKLLNKLNTGIF